MINKFKKIIKTIFNVISYYLLLNCINRQKSGAIMKEFVKLDGGHNDSWMCNGYYESIHNFLLKVNYKQL